MKSAKVRDILLLWVPFVATAIMLTLIQAPVGWSFLAWVSLVPFILVCRPDVKPKALAVSAYLVSLFYWLGNLYWMAYVTPIGWIAFCVYTALLWPVVALCLRWCRMKKFPLFLAAGILFVGAERLQGVFLGGFFWRFLAHSQYEHITLIQIADIFGAGGLSFLIAMVNGLVAELIIAVDEKRLLKVSNFIKTAVVCGVVVGAILYGRWRVAESAEYIEDGPMVASVQSNVPQSVKQSFQAEEQIFSELLAHSKQSAEMGAELIVWPETMVQAILEPQLLGLLDSSHSYRIFDKTLSEHARGNAFLLVGAYGGTPQLTEDFDIRLAQKYNSAFLYRIDGSKADQSYGKIHLVPFGEVLPFKNIPFLHNLLIKIGPYDFDYTLDAGAEYTVFEMGSSEGQVAQTYRFSVVICYEDAVPAVCRKFAVGKDGRKRIDWLINISNDGWFVKFKEGKVLPTTELAQHAAVCVFRAVENRIAILRSVNTGISCLIDPVGHIHNGFTAGDLPHQAMARQGCAGWFVDRVTIDRRITFFSKYGQWLDFCCALCLVLLIIAATLQRLVFREGTKR
ncbi:MAG: apolipoprotein N-acyltransferase [Planctomycetota bacterium]|nr:MAG: apolipoprotein N-acyltransferase [Planctomycetota bacterium]